MADRETFGLTKDQLSKIRVDSNRLNDRLTPERILNDEDCEMVTIKTTVKLTRYRSLPIHYIKTINKERKEKKQMLRRSDGEQQNVGQDRDWDLKTELNRITEFLNKPKSRNDESESWLKRLKEMVRNVEDMYYLSELTSNKKLKDAEDKLKAEMEVKERMMTMNEKERQTWRDEKEQLLRRIEELEPRLRKNEQKVEDETKTAPTRDGKEKKDTEFRRLGIQDLFTEEDEVNILKRLDSKRKEIEIDGVKITNCIFHDTFVEVCYCLDGKSMDRKHDEDALKEELVGCLAVFAEMIKLTRLPEIPKYRETVSTFPGEMVHDSPQPPSLPQRSTIGAFVRVEERISAVSTTEDLKVYTSTDGGDGHIEPGVHALVTGHGRTLGDTLYYRDGKAFGNVTVQTVGGNTVEEGHHDVALVRLENQDDFKPYVISSTNEKIYLSRVPLPAVYKMEVHRYATEAAHCPGFVKSKSHTSYTSQGDKYRMISIQDEAGRPIHNVGESGLLVTAQTYPEQGRQCVQPVGVMVGIEESPRYGSKEVCSLALPIGRNLQAVKDVLNQDIVLLTDEEVYV